MQQLERLPKTLRTVKERNVFPTLMLISNENRFKTKMKTPHT